MFDTKWIEDVDVSPDGARVAFIVCEYAHDAAGGIERRLHVSDAGGRAARHSELRMSSVPAWSAQGNDLAFIDDGRVWLTTKDLHVSRELKLPVSASTLKWSPDGSKLAVIGAALQPSLPVAGAQLWAPVSASASRASRLYIVDIERWRRTGEAAWLVRSPAERFLNHPYARGLDWSPDSKLVAYAWTPAGEPGAWADSDVAIVDVDSGGARPAAASPAAEFNPIFSPDGTKLAFVRSDEQPTSIRVLAPFVLDLGSGHIERLPPTPDDLPLLLGWSSSGDGIYFAETFRTRSTLGRIDRSGGGADFNLDRRLISELHLVTPSRPALLNAARTHVGMALESATEAPEAYVFDLQRQRLTRRSSVNTSSTKRTWPTRRTLEWSGGGATRIEGSLILPVQYRHGMRVPLLTLLHGGPPNVAQDTFTGRPSVYPLALLAARGIAVFTPNFTGSLGYGRNLRRALVGRVGNTDADDVQRGIDELIARGIADPQRLAVAGWSYGGYLTSVLVRASSRFKVASIGAGPANLASYTATSDFPQLFEDYLGGLRPWQAAASFMEHSPVFRPAGAHALILIQHGVKDARVPLGQAIENLYSLRTSGAQAELIAYPEAGHALMNRDDIEDAARRNLALFETMLR